MFTWGGRTGMCLLCKKNIQNKLGYATSALRSAQINTQVNHRGLGFRVFLGDLHPRSLYVLKDNYNNGSFPSLQSMSSVGPQVV